MKYEIMEYIDDCKVSIRLPLVNKMGELDLEVEDEERLVIENNVNREKVVEIRLNRKVDEESVKAKWNKKEKVLNVHMQYKK